MRPGRHVHRSYKSRFSNTCDTSSNYGYLKCLSSYPTAYASQRCPNIREAFYPYRAFVLVLGGLHKLQGAVGFITRTGEKYHEGSCAHLRSSKIPIALSEAKKRGYTACHVCHPGGLVSPVADIPENVKTKTDSTANEEQTSTQCAATTKAGTRCKRAASSNGRCWQHQ